MLGLRARIWRRMGLSCVEMGARVTGDVSFGKGVCVASGAEIVADAGGRVEVGAGSFLLKGSMLLTYGGRISIGTNVGINPYSIIYGHGGVTIGNDVLIAAACIIIPANHRFARHDVPIREQGLDCRGVVIEDDVWLGARVTVLDGVRIGRGAVVAAGSVVTRDVPPGVVAAGVPAKVVRSR